MSNTQANLDGSAQKTQKKQNRDQLLWTFWCIVVFSVWGISHAMDRYHENIKYQQQQRFARVISRTIKPQPVFHVELGKNKPSRSQADAVLHGK